MGSALLSIADRLGKLIPRLGTNHDGEKLATLAAIERTLKAKGLSFHDFARALAEPPPAGTVFERGGIPPDPADTMPATVRAALKRVDWLLEKPDQLSTRELNFVQSLRGQLRAGRAPSQKQATWLADVYARRFVTGDF